MLLLDAGNTRLKWARIDGGRRDVGVAPYDGVAALVPLLENGLSCYVASVARSWHAAVLDALFAPFSIRPVWLAAQPAFGGVTNGYADPSQLGVDRWMALIAARRRTDGAALVVSAGTALTIDALTADGRFIGGVIVPGIRLMRTALAAGTAEVSAFAGEWQPFPVRTGDAVESGIIGALTGAISEQYRRLAELAGAAPRSFVTGGDADALIPHLDHAAEAAPQLVLEGIEYVAKEEAGW